MHYRMDLFILNSYLSLMMETIAVFDFDGTITKKDTLIEFIKFSKGKWKFYTGFLLFLPLLIAMKLNIYPNWKVKQQLFSYFFKGISINDFNNLGRNFSVEINNILSPKAIKALKLHAEKDNKIILISASIENWIMPWAEKMGINRTLATKIETDNNGLLTGKFLSKNCYGQEKVNRLLEVLPNRGEYKVIAYGDSRGDKELLEFADESYYNKFE